MNETPHPPLPLQIEAERLASIVRQNVPSHRRVGFGEDYWQYRSYQGGEPATMIDWRQCARSTKLYVRDKDRPPPQTVYFWADRSPRMHKQPNPSSPAKADRAFTIAFALSHMLLRGGEKVVWLGPHLLTVNGMTGFRTLTSHFLPLQKTEELPPVTKISRHAHMIIFSDFSFSSEYWQNFIRSYASIHVRGAFCQIVNAGEAGTPPPFSSTLNNVGWHFLSHDVADSPCVVLSHIFHLLTAPLREAQVQENYAL